MEQIDRNQLNFYQKKTYRMIRAAFSIVPIKQHSLRMAWITAHSGRAIESCPSTGKAYGLPHSDLLPPSQSHILLPEPSSIAATEKSHFQLDNQHIVRILLG